MAEITKKNNENQPATHNFETDVFRMFRNLFHGFPMQGFATKELSTFMPSFEVKENAENYVIKADVPGIQEKDLDMSLSGNVLTIKGKREEEKRGEKDTFYTYERSYGSFARSFSLPEDADAANAQANLKDGVLTLTIAKTPKVQPKKIEVKKA